MRCILSLCRAKPNRRVVLMDLIHTGRLRTLQWRHRGRTRRIVLTLQSTAKLSRNTGAGIGAATGIVLKHFWLDGTFRKTDTFHIDRLSWT